MIRGLRPGEPVPEGAPRRYSDGHGYVRLRWKVGTRQYVEILEHRLVAEAAPGTHVHHHNRTKDDNRRINVKVLTPSEHASLHGAERRKFDVQRAVELYQSGLSTPEIGRIFGVDHSNVWRAINRLGIPMRPVGTFTDRQRGKLREGQRRAYASDPSRAGVQARNSASFWASLDAEARLEMGSRISAGKRAAKAARLGAA